MPDCIVHIILKCSISMHYPYRARVWFEWSSIAQAWPAVFLPQFLLRCWEPWTFCRFLLAVWSLWILQRKACPARTYFIMTSFMISITLMRASAWPPSRTKHAAKTTANTMTPKYWDAAAAYIIAMCHSWYRSHVYIAEHLLAECLCGAFVIKACPLNFVKQFPIVAFASWLLFAFSKFSCARCSWQFSWQH